MVIILFGVEAGESILFLKVYISLSINFIRNSIRKCTAILTIINVLMIQDYLNPT